MFILKCEKDEDSSWDFPNVKRLSSNLKSIVLN